MIIELLKKEGCPDWVIEHSIAVCQKAIEISKNFDVDKKLIEEAALLHDIGRSKTNSINHGIIGANLAIEHGFPKKVANIIEKHIGSGISKEEAMRMGLPEKNYIPMTIEEKIVSHADNLINGIDEVDIEFIVRKWENSDINNLEESVNRLKKVHKELIEDFSF
ncbi:TIGR00295 family protein [Methanobrevibacter sp. TMH8]|uniref:TIGR00295 family protein n=1 Tax=Methanobrevibacter sp. TMH8 TaxID=2848611 RepID=UPI001CCF64CD|nr:TIGR00295 family protein [Methanobrevibacter sp. TMH8]MBZ9570759.1 TIGR00295 family protein [Methanobrevibacter sp. TMH8]